MNTQHKTYPWRFRTFMRGDHPCRFRLPLHKWRVAHSFTDKTMTTHALWKCERCGGVMNTTARAVQHNSAGGTEMSERCIYRGYGDPPCNAEVVLDELCDYALALKVALLEIRPYLRGTKRGNQLLLIADKALQSGSKMTYTGTSRGASARKGGEHE